MAGTFLTQLDPTQFAGAPSTMLTNGMQASAYANYNVDEGGVQGDTSANGYAAFAPGAKRGDTEGLYDTSGKLTGTQQIRGDGFDLGEFAKGVAFVASFALGANALFGGPAAGAAEGGAAGATGGGAGPDFTSGFTDTGTAGGALDTQYAGSGALTGAEGGVTTQEMGDWGPEAEPYDENALPDEHDINTRPDVPDATSPDYRNGSDINSDIATEEGVAPPGSVNAGTPTQFYPNMPAPTVGSPFDFLKDLIAPATGTAGGSIIPALQTGALITSLLTGGTGGQAKQPAQTPQTPSQPMVGAGAYASGSAQGGASGSLAGVAGTLLTAKDTFGYGRSMLG